MILILNFKECDQSLYFQTKSSVPNVKKKFSSKKNIYII